MTNRQGQAPLPPPAAALLAESEAALRGGRLGDAVAAAQQVLKVAPGAPDALYLLGSALAAGGRFADAEKPLRVAAEAGRNPMAQLNLGSVLHKLGRLEEAETWYMRARARLTKVPDVFLNLGAVLLDLGRPGDALRNLRTAEKLDPKNPQTAINMIAALMRLDRVDEAAKQAEKAVRTHPRMARLHKLLSEVRVAQGRMDDAQTGLREAIGQGVDDPSVALAFLAQVRRFQGDEPELNQLRDLAGQAATAPSMDPRVRSRTLAAWSKVLDDLGQTVDAFDAMAQANSARRQAVQGSMDAVETVGRLTRELFTAEVMADLAAYACDDAAPVFIVGMPRSGTSLTEHLLAAHPQAVGLGETTVVEHQRMPLLQALRAGQRGTALEGPARQTVQGILKGLRGSHRDARKADRLIDKMPFNFWNLGLLVPLFPQATFLVMRRDPLDTCLSCFRASFPDALFWAMDLDELGRYHRVFDSLMAHWDSLFGDRLVDVVYEDLVATPEAQARRLVEAVGLPWDDAVLSAHTQARAVKTSSAAQVREPVHARSVGRAARYGARLDPLRRSLGLEPSETS